MKLTPLQHDALTQAHRRDGLRRIHTAGPGRPPWPAPPQTIHALVRRGLLEHDRLRTRKGDDVDVWKVTTAGKDALDPPARTRKDTVHWLGVGATTSKVMQGGVWQHQRFPEPEPVDPDSLDHQRWVAEANGKHDDADWRNAAGRDNGRAKAA